MPSAERYRQFYEHEKWANQKLLGVIESVPENARTSPKFRRAVNLAAHLAACRENWLDRMKDGGRDQVAWFEENAAMASLRTRFAALEFAWDAYLGSLEDADINRDFEFTTQDGKRYRWNIEGQIVQLLGHAFYHRGQIALLVDELGGNSEDTDYLYWAYATNPRWGLIE